MGQSPISDRILTKILTFPLVKCDIFKSWKMYDGYEFQWDCSEEKHLDLTFLHS